jgi:uncharacterized coiled-coil protein SlyX
MDMSAIDFGTLIAFVGLYLKTQQDKATAAEAVGVMKQQIKNLEDKAAHVDTRLDQIDEKLARVLASNTRLETQLNLLLNHRQGHHLIKTPVSVNN